MGAHHAMRSAGPRCAAARGDGGAAVVHQRHGGAGVVLADAQAEAALVLDRAQHDDRRLERAREAGDALELHRSTAVIPKASRQGRPNGCRA